MRNFVGLFVIAFLSALLVGCTTTESGQTATSTTGAREEDHYNPQASNEMNGETRAAVGAIYEIGRLFGQ